MTLPPHPEATEKPPHGEGRVCVTAQQLTNIKVPKETADLVRVYCIFNNRKVTEFTTGVLDRELAGFRRRLEAVRARRGA